MSDAFRIPVTALGNLADATKRFAREAHEAEQAKEPMWTPLTTQRLDDEQRARFIAGGDNEDDE